MAQCNCSRSAVGVQALYASSVPTFGGRLASSATTASALSLASAGTRPGRPGILAANNTYGGGAYGAYVDGVVAAPTPPVQVQMFESASYTCYPTFSVIPYGFGPTVSVMTPTAGTGVWNAYNQYANPPQAPPTEVLVDVDEDPVPVPVPAPAENPVLPFYTPAPEFSGNACGCCRTPFSVMPPSGVQAWRPLLDRVNAPYSALCPGGFGPACGGGF